MLNTMMEHKNKSLTNISNRFEITVADHSICDHDLRREIKIIV